jgi:hypothetical protein
MKTNAYVLNRTMNEYPRLLISLKEKGFLFLPDTDGDITVDVPFFLVEDFATLIQQHLNAPYNYVDVQFPDEKKTVLIFQNKKFIIENSEQNMAVKKWAIEEGLLLEQTDWSVSFGVDG